MEENIVLQNLSQIKQLMTQYGVERAYVFGSAIKGTMRPESDVDFLISFQPGLDYETYANNYFNLMHALQDLLKKDVDLLAEETVTNPYLIQSINRNKMQIV